MAEKTMERDQRATAAAHGAAVREVTRATNDASQRAAESVETSTRVLVSRLGEMNDSLARANWDAAESWLQLTSETWNTGARLMLAWLDICWQLGRETWTMALEQQAHTGRRQAELWSQWVRAVTGQEAETRQPS